MSTLKEAALKLHRVRKIVNKEYKLTKKCTKYLKKGYFDGDFELLSNRQVAASTYEILLRIESNLVTDVQKELMDVERTIRSYQSDGFLGIFYMVGAIVTMLFELFTALVLGI